MKVEVGAAVLGRAAIALFVAVLALPASGTLAAPSDPAPSSVQRGIVYAKEAGVRLRLDAYLPQSPRRPAANRLAINRPAADRAAVILVHGGGWRCGNRAKLRRLATMLARQGHVAFSIQYLLRERRFCPAGGGSAEPGLPRQVEAVGAAVNWVRGHARDFDVDPRRLALWGTSAGANLAVLQAVRGSGSRHTGDRVRAAVAWSGIYDLNDETALPAHTRGLVTDYLGCQPVFCSLLAAEGSPIEALDRTDPPLYVVHSRDDRSVPVRQAKRMRRAMRSAGVQGGLKLVSGRCHGLGCDATGSTLRFLREALRP